MGVGGRHPEPSHRVALKIELDKHHGLIANHPAVMARLNRNHLGRGELQHTAVLILDVYFTAGQETDMGVHTQSSAGDTLHVSGPAESRRIYDALDSRAAGANHIDLDATDIPVIGRWNGSEKNIRSHICISAALG
jgi:hypothetical protein